MNLFERLELPPGSLGRVLSTLPLAGRLARVSPRPGYAAGREVELRGTLRILSVTLTPWYEHIDFTRARDEHIHEIALALVIDSEVVEGSFLGVEPLGEMRYDPTTRPARVTHRVRVDPGRRRTGGRWAFSSLLFAPSDADAGARVDRALARDDDANLARRLALAVMLPVPEDSLERWLLERAPARLQALPWPEETRVERDGVRREVTLEALHHDPKGLLGVAYKGVFRLITWDVARHVITDIKEQEVYLGGSDWLARTLPAPRDPEPVIARWANVTFAAIRAALASPDRDAVMPCDLPLTPWLDPIMIEHGLHGPPPARPRRVRPRHDELTVATHGLDEHDAVATFSLGSTRIRVQTPNPWSWRVVLAPPDGPPCVIFEVDSDGLDETVRAIEEPLTRDVMRWLYECAARAGELRVTMPRREHDDDDDDDDDDDEIETRPLTELLGYLPERELIDWRVIPDDLDFVFGQTTTQDEGARATWRRFLDEHFVSTERAAPDPGD